MRNGAPLLRVLRSATVASAELFNQQERLIVTTLESNDEVCDHYVNLSHIRQTLHNRLPKAPEHIGMVNNIIDEADHGAPAAQRTQLHGGRRGRRQLGAHLASLDAPLARCCFQCGMLNAPTFFQTLRVLFAFAFSQCNPPGLDT